MPARTELAAPSFKAGNEVVLTMLAHTSLVVVLFGVQKGAIR